MTLTDLIERLSSARILCVGDVMLDRYVSGAVERISPEAPIPVLRIERETAMLGGAGNVISNIAALGGGGRFLAVAGNDTAGREVEHLLTQLGNVTPHILTDADRPTTLKTRFVAGTQQLIRADAEKTGALSDDLEVQLLNATATIEDGIGAVVLSDYGKGMLSDAAIAHIIQAAKAQGVRVIVDPKGSDYTRYTGADLITPNKKELKDATNMAVDTDADVISACNHLIETCAIGGVLATRSGEGMTLVSAQLDAPHHLGAQAREVFDVSGAGDTVVATLSLALAAGADMVDAARLANVAAGIVVAKVGTATVSTQDLLRALHQQDINKAEAKLLDLGDAEDVRDRWRAQGHAVGFTNGCFDLLHPGHISLLTQARGACDKLVVGLNSDSSVRMLKGETRPVQTEAARAAVLGALSVVDMIVLFSDQTPITLIETLKPDVLVKGADYTIETVVGADIVHSYGGKVVLADLVDGQSTTNTIAKMAQ
ncbi:D-glycero-beta-D-manno-heptose-7-phosphate kinase [Magnetovibrio sp. PR-2]|uniref:D-glycero-beta-D-manno-heptose-7-phosphate kinase n=1 Tax=Magnetovibrio sp. PR-2 TaxID=3120356 RepID=UPI002FCE46BD